MNKIAGAAMVAVAVIGLAAPAEAAQGVSKSWVEKRLAKFERQIDRKIGRPASREFDVSTNFRHETEHPGKAIIEEFDNGIVVHTFCDNRTDGEIVGMLFVSADEDTDASAQIGNDRPVMLEAWGSRPDPSSPDRSSNGFTADDETDDDRLAVFAVPTIHVLAVDGLEFRIVDARIHLNNADDCRFIGTIEPLSDD